jgi:hypothetical protein
MDLRGLRQGVNRRPSDHVCRSSVLCVGIDVVVVPMVSGLIAGWGLFWASQR